MLSAQLVHVTTVSNGVIGIASSNCVTEQVALKKSIHTGINIVR